MMKKTLIFFLTILMSISACSAAFASESGLFSEMNETEYADERLPLLDEVAETVSESMSEGSVTVEISQAYYEGNRVFISYRANSRISEQDGLNLEDGSYADIIAGGTVWNEDGSIIGWKECIVPEDEPAPVHTFFLVFTMPETNEEMMLGVTLNRHEYSRFLKGVSSAEAYQAEALLCMGRIDMKGTVTLTSPEQAASWLAWQEGEEETGNDVITSWNLYRNGELVSCDLFGEIAVNDTEVVTFTVLYPVMEELDGLTLVPEYSEGGEKPDEAIALEAVDQK